jgi:GAF domain-containing protein
VVFLRTLSAFARALPSGYDVEVVLEDLTDSVSQVLALSGAGVSLVDSGRLRMVTAAGAAFEELELVQEQTQRGPCRDAFDSGVVVSCADVRTEQDRWPEYAAGAQRLDVAAVAGVPMRLADQTIGALNLYDAAVRDWSEDDLAAAGVLADVATSYLVNASTLHQQQQLNEQLTHALESRVVLEQAKGMTARDAGVSVDEAHHRIRRHARSHNTSLRAVAEAIVELGLRV